MCEELSEEEGVHGDGNRNEREDDSSSLSSSRTELGDSFTCCRALRAEKIGNTAAASPQIS